MPLRIYDIAKKLGLENKEVLAKAKFLNIAFAKVPSSSLDKFSAEQLQKELLKDHPEIVTQLASLAEQTIHHAQKVLCLDQFKIKVVGDLLIIDSNIWMNLDYEPLFEVLILLKQNCVIVGDQLDEISNKKNRTPYGSDQNKVARLAIDRVEKLQEADLLEIPDVTFEPNKGALADPQILKYAVSETGQKKFVTIVTDDKELRVRAKAILKKKAPQLHRVLKGSDLLGDAHRILGFPKISFC